MKRRRGLWIAVVVAAGLMTALSLGQGGPADASSLSKSPAGWSAARQYLEHRATATRTLDESPEGGLDGSFVLVVSGSAAQGFSNAEMKALNNFLTGGGRLVLGYSDSLRSGSMREKLGVPFKRSEGASRSLNPLVWRREASRTLKVPVRDQGPLLAVRGTSEYPAAESGDSVLLRNEKHEPIVVLRQRGKGEVLLLPVEVFSNARLKEPGNGALLESLRTRFGEGTEWVFDEYHHGIVRASSPTGLKSRRALDLFLFQILLAYVLFALAIGRRFGPEWPEPRVASGATGAFLMTIAAIHDRLGHHALAADALRERAKEVLGIEVPQGTTNLVEVARRIHHKQKEGRNS